jgi:hypothetical protein
MNINNPNNTQFTISEDWCYSRNEKLYQAWQYRDGNWSKICSSSSLHEILERVKCRAAKSKFTIEWRKE